MLLIVRSLNLLEKPICYLSDMIGAGGGTEPSTIACVRSGWKSFRVLLLLLSSQVIPLKKRRSYGAWVRGVIFMLVRPSLFRRKILPEFPELIR